MNKILVFCLFVFVLASCSKTEQIVCNEKLNCNNDLCLFTINNEGGQTILLTCFNKWGIYAPSANIDEADVWLIVDNWDPTYEAEGIDVVFCGYVRQNTVPLVFPDPSIGAVYQIELAGIEKK